MKELRPARPQRSAAPDQAPLAKSASTPAMASVPAHPAQSLSNGQAPSPKEHPLEKKHSLQKEHAPQKEVSAAIHIVAKASASIAPRTPEQQSRWLVFQARVSEQAAEEKAQQQQGSQVSACPPPHLTLWCTSTSSASLVCASCLASGCSRHHLAFTSIACERSACAPSDGVCQRLTAMWGCRGLQQRRRGRLHPVAQLGRPSGLPTGHPAPPGRAPRPHASSRSRLLLPGGRHHQGDPAVSGPMVSAGLLYHTSLRPVLIFSCS